LLTTELVVEALANPGSLLLAIGESMRFFLFSLIVALPLFAGNVLEARADTWKCEMRGEMSGVKLGFLFGGQVIKGDGNIHCEVEQTGGAQVRTVAFPVRISIVGGGIGFDFTVVHQMEIFTAGIGGIRNPQDLLGQFSVSASAGITLIDQGRNVDAAISVKHRARGLGFEVGMIGEDAIGLGARVHGLVFLVEPRK